MALRVGDVCSISSTLLCITTSCQNLTVYSLSVWEGADKDTGEIDVSKRELIFIRDHLVSAEIARRRGDTPAVYEAYIRCWLI